MPILDLVRTLVRLSGKTEQQVTIKFTGLRDGEKLVEELFYWNEEVGETSFTKIKRARGPLHDWPALARKLEDLEATLFLNGSSSIRAKIKEIVPEYSYASVNESDPDEDGKAWARRAIA
jgi:FlaA1/EpsC-like NDP-sugar epimerase